MRTEDRRKQRKHRQDEEMKEGGDETKGHIEGVFQTERLGKDGRRAVRRDDRKETK